MLICIYLDTNKFNIPYQNVVYVYIVFRQGIMKRAQKKVIFLMTGPLSPPPELNGSRNFFLCVGFDNSSQFLDYKGRIF